MTQPESGPYVPLGLALDDAVVICRPFCWLVLLQRVCGALLLGRRSSQLPPEPVFRYPQATGCVLKVEQILPIPETLSVGRQDEDSVVQFARSGVIVDPESPGHCPKWAAVQHVALVEEPRFWVVPLKSPGCARLDVCGQRWRGGYRHATIVMRKWSWL